MYSWRRSLFPYRLFKREFFQEEHLSDVTTQKFICHLNVSSWRPKSFCTHGLKKMRDIVKSESFSRLPLSIEQRKIYLTKWSSSCIWWYNALQNHGLMHEENISYRHLYRPSDIIAENHIFSTHSVQILPRGHKNDHIMSTVHTKYFQKISKY